jgi:hypothetical protein
MSSSVRCGRQRLQEPDVRDRRGQFDVAHALAAHLGERDLNAALLADDALVLHPLVLAAQALVVLDRTENARAEQAVALRLERTVVDGLRLFDLAERPGEDFLRAGDRDPDLVETLGIVLCGPKTFWISWFMRVSLGVRPWALRRLAPLAILRTRG